MTDKKQRHGNHRNNKIRIFRYNILICGSWLSKWTAANGIFRRRKVSSYICRSTNCGQRQPKNGKSRGTRHTNMETIIYLRQEETEFWAQLMQFGSGQTYSSIILIWHHRETTENFYWKTNTIYVRWVASQRPTGLRQISHNCTTIRLGNVVVSSGFLSNSPLALMK